MPRYCAKCGKDMGHNRLCPEQHDLPAIADKVETDAFGFTTSADTPVYPIFSVITRDGTWYRSYVEEADSKGFYVSDPRDRDETSAYHDTGGIVCIPWDDIVSITRDGQG